MKWLPKSDAFRERFAAAAALENGAERLEALALLAAHDLSLIETIQLDRALTATAPERNSRFAPVRLAVLTASTVDHLMAPLRVAGLRRGLFVETYGSAYGQYRQELLDSGSPLHSWRPDTVLFSFVAKDFLGAVPLDTQAAAAADIVDAAIADIRAMWARARDGFGATILQQSFLDTAEPLFGGLDAIVPGAPARLVSRLNAGLADAAGEDGVLWLDVARASARDGLDLWFDPVRWLQAKMEIAPAAAGRYGDLAARLIAAARGRSKKCLVLDLDNTLWGGVVGDDGVEGIVLGEGSALGEAHLALQRYALQLRDRGVILAVCSKNDPEIAEAAFRDHPEMLLKRSDFAAFVANWTDKAANLEAIARSLNIGPDALVFVDDNPAERARVRESLPMVAVPELPEDPSLYVNRIADAGYFESVAFTAEDLNRAGQYAANAERESLARAAVDMDSFLQQLAMSVEFGPATPVDIPRVTQLINKTNQFNTTTIRRSEQEIADFAANPDALLRHFRLVDKFGDNGIVSVMIATRAADRADVFDLVNWVMSCRVFGRQLEDESLNIFVEEVRRLGAHGLRARFTPTEKNGVIRDLFARLGFTAAKDAGGGDGSGEWFLDLVNYEGRPTRIARKELVHD